jgi:polyisoprenoid-binding protein YceI
MNMNMNIKKLRLLNHSVLAGLLLCCGGPSFAAIQYGFKKDVGQVRFEAQGKPKLMTISGDGVGVDGKLAEDQGSLKGELSFQLDSLQTHLALRDHHMKDKYLQTAQHPTAKVTDIQIKLPEGWMTTTKEAKSLAFTGILELHGQKQPITGTADLKDNGGKIHLQAQFPVQLSKHGIDIPSFAGVVVAEDIKVFVNTDVEVLKQ